MTPRSPIAALIWELWRVTRTEVAWKLALPIGVGVAVLALGAALAPADNPDRYQDINDLTAAFALILIVMPHLSGWLSMGKLNGGQPGFPLYLLYTQPIRTVMMVGLPMAYLTALSVGMYLVSALVLRAASGHAFPLLPVAGWIAALALVMQAGTWTTRDRALPMVVMMLAVAKGFVTAMQRLTAVEIPRTFDWPPRLWPSLFDFPRTDYVWIALIGVACFGVTVAGVMRQRRGDGWSQLTSRASPERDGLWDRLGSVFRFPCPTSSATRAQVWFDLRSNGVPVLTLGVAFAIVILLLSAVSGPIDAALNANPAVSCPIAECFYVRALPPLVAPLTLAVMLFLGGNAFGIRRRQGRTYVSAFEATHAHGTAQLAVQKVFVKSICLLAALVAIAASVWISMPLLGDAVFMQMWSVPLNSQRSAITDAVAALTAYEQLALVVVAAVGVGVWVASWAAMGALWTRYGRRMNIAIALVLLYAVALVLLALAGQRWSLPLGAILRATSWAAAAAIVVATAYLVWRTLAERLVTVRQATVVVFLSAVFAAAWLTLLRTVGLSLADMPAADAARMLSLAVLPFTVGILAPWSYSRVRHT